MDSSKHLIELIGLRNTDVIHSKTIEKYHHCINVLFEKLHTLFVD